jgi:peptide deformylase
MLVPKLFFPKEIPEGVKSYRVLNYKQIKIRSQDMDLKEESWEPSESFQNTIARMIATCLSDDGIGLSAPQIGVFKRYFIIREFDLEDSGREPEEGELDDAPFSVYINPSFSVDKNIEKVWGREGCLSVPSQNIPVKRYEEIKVSYWTISSDMKKLAISKTLKGWKARVFLHELDHLNGKSIVDHR